MSETSAFSDVSSSSADPADCVIGIELTREVSTYDAPGRQQAWRMRVTVTDYENVDPNIFVYLRRPAETGDSPRDTFEAVASPVDIEEYPVGAPLEGDTPPFFRAASVDLLARNRLLIDETWDMIVADRDELVRTLTGICELERDAVSRFGFSTPEAPETEPEPGESSEPEEDDLDKVLNDTVTRLVVTSSNDPDFPEGAVLPNILDDGAPTYVRRWKSGLGAVDDSRRLELRTSLLSNEFDAYIESGYGATQTLVDSGGMSDTYRIYVYYEKQPNDERLITLEAGD